MNTIEVNKLIDVHSFEELYKYAQKQFLEFEVIEGVISEPTLECWKKYSFSIDCPQDQMKFKDMLQIRFIEELTEASIAYREREEEHFREEITDALNFILSAYVMLGVDFKKLPDPEYSIKNNIQVNFSLHHIFYGLVEDVGYLCNLLKNRPWSQTNYLVSMTDFNKRLETLWFDFWVIISLLGFTKEDIFDMFSKKYSVNMFRIETGY